MFVEDLEIITVNYNTPDLLEKLITSINTNDHTYPIRVIDGSDTEAFQAQVKAVCDKYDNVSIEPQGYNIHHGKGMDLGLRTSTKKWCLTVDTDVEFKHTLVQALYTGATKNNKLICGHPCWTDTEGNSVGKHDNKYCVKYYHPALCLWNTEYYMELRVKGIKCIHHGAPNIQLMNHLHNTKEIDNVAISVWDTMKIDANEKIKFINIGGRGTVNRFGYSWGTTGVWGK